MSTPLNRWPKQLLPREKLLQQGAGQLSDAELLAIFIRTGIKNLNALDLAQALLIRFDGLHGLLSANLTQCRQQKGLGPAKYCQLQASLELAKRFMQAELRFGQQLNSAQLTRQYLLSELKSEAREIFALLLLNNQHQVIAFKRLFNGTIDAAAVYPRVVVEQALKHQAAAVIFCHNHPSGVNEPSQADIHLTKRLVNALALVEIRALDHIIVAGHQTYSFAEQGLMPHATITI